MITFCEKFSTWSISFFTYLLSPTLLFISPPSKTYSFNDNFINITRNRCSASRENVDKIVFAILRTRIKPFLTCGACMCLLILCQQVHWLYDLCGLHGLYSDIFLLAHPLPLDNICSMIMFHHIIIVLRNARAKYHLFTFFSLFIR